MQSEKLPGIRKIIEEFPITAAQRLVFLELEHAKGKEPRIGDQNVLRFDFRIFANIGDPADMKNLVRARTDIPIVKAFRECQSADKLKGVITGLVGLWKPSW